MLFFGTAGLAGGPLPDFERGTVLVFRADNQGFEYSFVIRIAQFRPDLYFEWENQTTQGTVLLRRAALESGQKYVNYRLFQPGSDMESGDETTCWLSRGVFEALKEQGWVQLKLDAMKSKWTLLGTEEVTLQVNGNPQRINTLHVRDGRGGNWWILDDPENPLVVGRELNRFKERLVSVKTGQPGSLRWIKGTRLKSLPPRP